MVFCNRLLIIKHYFYKCTVIRISAVCLFALKNNMLKFQLNLLAPMNRKRKLLFRIITLAFPLLLLLALEGGLRLASYGDRLSLFVPVPREGYEHYLMANPLVGNKYFQVFQSDAPANDIFLRKKAEGSFRVFVMGSSTVVGFPHEYNLMFSRILHLRLREAYPTKHIEVINTAITAINSFTLADFARQIARHQPDAVLVYAGHNEFYGAFGVGSNESMSKSLTLTRLHLQLMDLRLYQLLRNLAASVTGKMSGDAPGATKGTLMKRIVADRTISLGSKKYELAMKRYRQNMDELLTIFDKRGVPVFLSQVISNVKDIQPFSALSTGMEDEALKSFNRASLHYRQGNYQEALDFFYEAKDLDGVRFRASEEVNRIIHELSQEHRLYEIPMMAYFREKSPHGIIGNNLLTEHVHPKPEGNFLMADAFFSALLESGLLGTPDQANLHSSDYHMLNWGYTALDTLLAHHRITNLKKQWPFVPADAESPDYRASYRPVSELDSLAFRAMADPDLTLAELRLDLARKYQDRGYHKEAFGEFNALLYTNPYLAVNYRDAASSLIWLGDLPLALTYFMQSLELEASAYAHFRMGEIYLIKGDYGNAANNFESAFSLSDNEEEKLKILGKMYMAASYGGQDERALALSDQLKKYGAERYLKIPPRTYSYLNYIPYKTRKQVVDALQLIGEKRTGEALAILEKSLDIYDSHVARRYLGELYLQEGKVVEAREQFDRVYGEFRFDPSFLNLYNALNNNISQ